jgi:hypothetical protein
MVNVVIAKKPVIQATVTTTPVQTTPPVTLQNDSHLTAAATFLTGLRDVDASLKPDGASLVYNEYDRKFHLIKIDSQIALDGGYF